MIMRKRKYGKTTKKRMKVIRENLVDESKEKLHKAAKKRMKTIRENKKESRDEAFDEAKNCSMIDLLILKLKAFKIIQEEYLLYFQYMSQM